MADISPKLARLLTISAVAALHQVAPGQMTLLKILRPDVAMAEPPSKLS